MLGGMGNSILVFDMTVTSWYTHAVTSSVV